MVWETIWSQQKHCYITVIICMQSQQKNNELKNIITKKHYNFLKEEYENINSALRPMKVSYQVDGLENASNGLFSKFGVYTSHLQHCISTTTNYEDRSTAKRKYLKLIDASKLFGCVLFLSFLLKWKSLVLWHNRVKWTSLKLLIN